MTEEPFNGTMDVELTDNQMELPDVLCGGIPEDNISLELKDYNITKVLDDVILAEYIEERPDDKEIDRETGMVKKGAFFMAEDKFNDAYKPAKALMVGKNVKEISEGDTFIFAGGSDEALMKGAQGIIMVEFQGRKFLLISEQKVFFVLEKK